MRSVSLTQRSMPARLADHVLNFLFRAFSVRHIPTRMNPTLPRARYGGDRAAPCLAL